jgi:hypothetical protein
MELLAVLSRRNAASAARLTARARGRDWSPDCGGLLGFTDGDSLRLEKATPSTMFLVR